MNNVLKGLIYGIIALLASCGPFGTGSYFRRGVKSYRGDGTIRDTSRAAVFFASRGFRIDLPNFPIDRPYEHTFRIAGIPVINDTQAGVFLELPPGMSSTVAGKSRATFEMAIFNKNGIQITHVKGPLNSYIWSGTSLYDSEHSWFKPDEDESYKMYVRFSPGSGLGKGFAHVYIKCHVGGL